MATALGRRAKRLDVSVQARAMIAPAPLIVVAAAAPVSAAVGLVAVPELTPLGVGGGGCVGAFVVWQGVSMLWSIEPDRTWNYLNRAVVYLAFLLLGLVVGRLRRAPEYAAGWLALVTAAAVCSALGTKIFPGLSAETERVSRLNTPIGYWNVLALLVVFALPLALWIAAPPNRPDWLRAAGVLYLYAALVALVLTFSRGGLAVGIAAVGLWIAIGRPRLESAAALALALVPTLAVCGWAFSRPGLTKDGQPHSLQVHDGRWFGLALRTGSPAVGDVAPARRACRRCRRRGRRRRRDRGSSRRRDHALAGPAQVQRAHRDVAGAGSEQPDEPLLEQPLELVAGGVEVLAEASGRRDGRRHLRPHSPQAARGRDGRDGAPQPAAPVPERDRDHRLRPLPRDRVPGRRGAGRDASPAREGGPARGRRAGCGAVRLRGPRGG